MKTKSLIALARVFLTTWALALGIAVAHAQGFDAKKFFERLQTEGHSMRKDFDGQKFFDKLAAEGNSPTNKIDAKTFFERLQADGNMMSKDFDAKKFFEKLDAEGHSNLMPPMVAKPN